LKDIIKSLRQRAKKLEKKRKVSSSDESKIETLAAERCKLWDEIQDLNKRMKENDEEINAFFKKSGMKEITVDESFVLQYKTTKSKSITKKFLTEELGKEAVKRLWESIPEVERTSLAIKRISVE